MKQLFSIALIAVLLISCTSNSKNVLVERELVDGESIEMEWGQCLFEETEESTCLLLEVKKWPEGGVIVIPGMNTRIEDIYLKAKPKYHFAWRFHKGNLQVHTSSFKGEAESNVLVVKIKGKVKIAKTPIQPEQSNV